MSESTILIVEDNEMNQRLLVRQLARLGVVDLAIASDGADALNWLAANTCRLILADCQMPRMDGYEMTRRIRARESSKGNRLPIIALTASAMREDKLYCTEAGMDGHIAKPTQLDSLRSALQPWLGPLQQTIHK